MVIPILEVGLKLLDKLIPDPTAKAQAQVELLKLQQGGEFKELESRMNAITTEASSTDPLTSRARPTFLYVMYIMMLFSLPTGLAYVFHPAETELFISGTKLWLGSIPEEMWWLFGAGYLGYTTARSVDKKK